MMLTEQSSQQRYSIDVSNDKAISSPSYWHDLEAFLKIAQCELTCALPPDLIQVQRVSQLPVVMDGRGLSYELFPGPRGNRYWLSWAPMIGIWVDEDGQAVELVIADEPAIAVLESSIMNFMTASVLGTCLNLQSRVAVHANAVAIDRQAVAFVGHSGRGKSTLTAFSLSQGAGLVSDDVLTVNDTYHAIPGYPRIKLFPHTAEQLGLQVYETNFKTHYHPEALGGKLQTDPVPLRVIYLLEESQSDRIYSEPVPSSEAVFELISHSYYARYFVGSKPQLLDTYAEMISHVPVERLYYPRDFTRLPNVFAFMAQAVNA